MKRIIRNITFILLLAVSTACSEELLEGIPEAGSAANGSEVEIFVDNFIDFSSGAGFNYGDILTRQVDDPKTSFQPGDRIHVQGDFYDDAGELVERSYKVFEMNIGGSWNVRSENPMLWPPKAKTGTFKAYYIQRYQDILETDDIKRSLRLSEIEDRTDPLYAEATYDWGHKVMLHFHHICTHLTFTNLDPDITDYFWLINKAEQPMANVFNIWLTGDYEIKTEFVSEGDNNYDGLVYVQHRAKNLYVDNIKTAGEVSFFLQPGDYSNVELRTINNYSYLAYKSEATSELKANVPYVIDIKVNKGVTFVEEEENWEDDDSTVRIWDPDAFLQSIVDGSDYFIEHNGEKTKIVQSTSDGSLLLRNVSFGGEKSKGNFMLPSGSVFDGGNHYIEDITTNLFSINRGTIQHLGIRNVKCNDVELTYAFNDDNSRWGALCFLNAGNIHNIRIENSEVTFRIGEGKSVAENVFNVGMAIGSSTGTLSNVTYGGYISVTGQSQNEMQATVNIGGIVGQSARLNNVSPLDNNSRIEIDIEFQGSTTTLYAGGAVGQSADNIENVSMPNVSVDLSRSKGLVGSAGGVVGRLITNNGSPSLLSSCTVAGEIKGMPVENYDMLNAYSYTGGLAGYVNYYNVLNCRALCNVSVTETGATGAITYATGGCLGRIVTTTTISGNYAMGSQLTGPENYIGNFAGIVPVSLEWTDYQNAGNVAKEIIPNRFIGGSITDN